MATVTPYCQCLYYSVNALARKMTALAEEAFSAVGLAPSHAFLLLSTIERPGIQPGELSEILMLKPSTITRLIEKLESRDLVHRKSDKKASHVFPTKKGMRMEDDLRRAWSALFERYSTILGKDEARKLTSMAFDATLILEQE